MRHIHPMTKKPMGAQVTCSSATTEFEAMVCFIMNILTGFILPVIQTKKVEEDPPAT